MQMKEQLKDLFWVGAAKKEIGALPDEVVDMFGYALHLAQSGLKHGDAKPLNPRSDIDMRRMPQPFGSSDIPENHSSPTR